MNKLLHLVQLNDFGGVELQFIETTSDLPRWEHHALISNHKPPALLNEPLQQTAKSIWFEKYAGNFRLPSWPKFLRFNAKQRCLKAVQPDLCLLWSRPTARHFDDVLNFDKVVYWEHGAAWFARKNDDDLFTFFENIPYVICNSFASKRMIELRWKFKNHSVVVLNAIRPSILKEVNPAQLAPSYTGDVLTLGTAGRMVPIKAQCLAIHTLKTLRDQGTNARLKIAGNGPELEKLTALVAKLNLESHVDFLGFTKNMATFYKDIDLYLHTSIRESFGGVCAEAQLFGKPVVTVNVDGQPEVMQAGITGECIDTTIAIEKFESFGGTNSNLPPLVYQPQTDTIGAPKLSSPEDLAAGVQRIIATTVRYAEYSAAAHEFAKQAFSHERYIQQVDQALDDALACVHAHKL